MMRKSRAVRFADIVVAVTVLQGMNLGHPPVLAGDIELAPVGLVDPALELRRQLEPPLLIHAGWVIPPEHPSAPSQKSPIFWLPQSAGRVHSLPWPDLQRFAPFCSTFDHFRPQSIAAICAVKEQIE